MSPMSQVGGADDSDADREASPASARRPVDATARPHASRVRPSLGPLERSVRRWSSGFLLPSAALFGGIGAWAWAESRGDRSVAWLLFGLAAAFLACFLAARRFPVITFGLALVLHVVVAPFWFVLLYPNPAGAIGTGLFPYLAYRGFHAARKLHRARKLAPAQAKKTES